MARLDGAVTIVTGAGGGIGRATAQALAENGARVADAIALLIGDESSFMTGAVVPVEAGHSAS